MCTSLLLYGHIVSLWWTFDDLFHVRFLLANPPLEYCFAPAVWSQLPFKMFTPLQFLSYHLDLVAFGLRPERFYQHQLVALATASAMLYALLRRWLPVLLSWVAATLFLLGIPTAFLITQLMMRHYLEGLTLAAVAVWFFVGAVRNGRPAGTFLSALAYLLAMLQKEIYVPLLGLLLILPEGTLRSRMRACLPHVVAAALYLVWRWKMLGSLLGGYGWVSRRQDLPQMITKLPVRLIARLVGNVTAMSIVLLLCLLAGALWALRRRRAWAVVLIAAILIVGPILPVSRSVNERFGMLPWLTLVVAFVLGCEDLLKGTPGSRLAASVLLLFVTASSVICNRADWAERYAEAERMSTEGRFFLTMTPGDVLRHPHLTPSAMSNTRWLKEEFLGGPKGSGWFSDDVFLCRAQAPSSRIWQYDDGARGIRDVTESALREASRYCSALRRDAPLTAHFEATDDGLFWRLGPYANGKYSLVFQNGVQAISVRRDDGYQTDRPELSLMVRYESPAGWVTYSPALQLDFRRSRRIGWDRVARN